LSDFSGALSLSLSEDEDDDTVVLPPEQPQLLEPQLLPQLLLSQQQ